MPLFPVTMDSPGRWGLNLQESKQVLHRNWATLTDGLVLNDSGQLAARGSISITTTAPASAELLRLHNYINAAGTEIIISTTATKILQSVGDLTSAGNDITPTGTPTNGFWKFINFNGKVLGWQASHTPIFWANSGDFAVITVSDGGTLPDGDCAHAAFGRVWAVDDDKQTVRYSGLLDETQWATASGAGSIDMRNVWTQGLDYVTAIGSLGANLVIFGRKHIVIYTDGSGSSVGLDPTQMYVVDVVEGTGCVARDSVTAVGEGDLVFLSEVGLQSLRRVVQSKDNPLVTISWQIGDHLAAVVKAELASQASPATDARGFTTCYVPTTDQLFLIQNRSTIEDVYVFHVGVPTQDERGRDFVPITYWDTSVLTNMRQMIQTRGGTIYVTGGTNNHINTYDPNGSLDNSTVPIYSIYESGWMAWDDPQLAQLNKTMKFAQLTIENSATLGSTTTFRYGTDFSATLEELDGPEADALITRNVYDTTGDHEGQHFKVGIEDVRFGGKSIQQLVMHYKPGRIAFVHDVEGQGEVSTPELSADLQLLVAVSDSNSSTSCVQTSMDGSTWVARTAIQAAWKSVCWSTDLKLLVAVAANSIMTSPDGITWTTRSSPGNGGWRSVTWSHELSTFVAVGQSLSTQRVMKSSDGITWSLVTTPANCDLSWTSVIWSSRLRCFVAGQGTNNGRAMRSLDGDTWTLIQIASPLQDTSFLVESGDYIIASQANDSDVWHTPDSVNWSNANSVVVSNQFGGVAYSPTLDLFVVAAGIAPSGLYTAPGDDPATWTGRATNGTRYTCGVWSTVLEKFIFLNTNAANDEGAVSSNGTSWSTITTASTQNWFSVCETEEV